MGQGLGVAMSTKGDSRSAGACPKCGSTDVIKVVYGEPDLETFEAWNRGELALGGPVTEEDAPAFECRACKRRFGQSADQQPE